MRLLKMFLFFAMVTTVACKSGSDAGANSADAPVKMNKEQYIAAIEENNAYLSNAVEPDSILFVSRRQVELCEEFAKAYHADPKTPVYLNYGAKAARASQQYEKAINFYNQILESYGDFQDMPEIMFMKGFVYDSELKQKDNARDAYTALIRKYPGHKLSNDARMLLTQLYMTDEELIKMLEEKNK